MGGNISLLMILVALWGVLAVLLMVLMVYRGVVGRNEELELMVDVAERHLATEQQHISEKIERLSTPIRILSFAVGGLLLVIVAVWIYSGLQST